MKMTLLTPRRRLAGLLALATVLGTGCNPLLLGEFLFPGLAPKNQPTLMKLKPPPEKEVARVVIIASAPIDTSAEFVRVDRELTGALTKHIKNAYEANKQKINIISSRKVEQFKDDHPDWHTMELAEIGKRFGADYVIHLEIQSMSLYERGSANLMFRGRASIGVAAVDMKHQEDDAVKQQFESTYPTDARGPVAVSDTNLIEFKTKFIESIAQRLTMYFVEHDTKD